MQESHAHEVALEGAALVLGWHALSHPALAGLAVGAASGPLLSALMRAKQRSVLNWKVDLAGASIQSAMRADDHLLGQWLPSLILWGKNERHKNRLGYMEGGRGCYVAHTCSVVDASNIRNIR